MPQTAQKGYEVQTTGTNSGTWGDTLNTNVLDFVDLNLAGVTSKTLSSSNVTLSATESRSAMLRLTGTLSANVTVTYTSNVSLVVVENLTSGNFTVNVGNGNAPDVTVPQSRRALLYLGVTFGSRLLGLASITNPNPIPVGTAMLFMNSAVPLGWIGFGGFSDYALRLSTSSGGATGGVVAASTLFGRTSVDGHALSIAELPSHTHDLTLNSNGFSAGGSQVWAGSAISAGNTTGTSDPAGSGGSHAHGLELRVKRVTALMGVRS